MISNDSHRAHSARCKATRSLRPLPLRGRFHSRPTGPGYRATSSSTCFLAKLRFDVWVLLEPADHRLEVRDVTGKPACVRRGVQKRLALAIDEHVQPLTFPADRLSKDAHRGQGLATCCGRQPRPQPAKLLGRKQIRRKVHPSQRLERRKRLNAIVHDTLGGHWLVRRVARDRLPRHADSVC
jgi:hypothetical protein